MKVVIQRVSSASVNINQTLHAQIGHGLLVLIGIESKDELSDADWLAQKVVGLRIFSDEEGKMNFSVKDVAGELLLVSQFTLHASTEKGNRPSFINAARPEQANSLYEYFIKSCEKLLGNRCQTGVFGADMKINLVNDGPVTIIIDSKNRV